MIGKANHPIFRFPRTLQNVDAQPTVDMKVWSLGQLSARLGDPAGNFFIGFITLSAGADYLPAISSLLVKNLLPAKCCQEDLSCRQAGGNGSTTEV